MQQRPGSAEAGALAAPLLPLPLLSTNASMLAALYLMFVYYAAPLPS
jgi:hypothetical protein